ncbi:hypothetical protein N9Q05_02470 [bacterium]|nr:hypothetical protein [bacterium]
MDGDELAWAINDAESEREEAINQVVELTAIIKELKNKQNEENDE